MALDIYVMPLWRFKVGDYISPIEAATGIRPKIIINGEVQPQVDRTSLRWIDRFRAKREVRSFCKIVGRENHSRISWRDKGDSVYAQQSQGMAPLQAFARWLDKKETLPEFGAAPDGDYYKHPAFDTPVPASLSYLHLVHHDCWSGYYFPCDFTYVVEVRSHTRTGEVCGTRRIGSTPRLLLELDALQKHLRVPPDYDCPHDDPLAHVKAAYLELRHVAELSARHGLPIIFWG